MNFMCSSNFNFIEIAYDNCEAVIIEKDAIITMDFSIDKVDVIYDNGTLYNINKLDNFEIKLNISDNDKYSLFSNQRFRHVDKSLTEGEYCFDRLVKSNDISTIIINGVSYAVPWDCKVSSYVNDLQKNNLIGNELYITIQKEEKCSQ